MRYTSTLIFLAYAAFAGVAYGASDASGDDGFKLWCCPSSNSDGSTALESYSVAADGSNYITCTYGNDQCNYHNPSGIRLSRRALLDTTDDTTTTASSSGSGKCPTFARPHFGSGKCPNPKGTDKACMMPPNAQLERVFITSTVTDCTSTVHAYASTSTVYVSSTTTVTPSTTTTKTVTATQTCLADGSPCQFDNPGACCVGACTGFGDGGNCGL